MKQKIKVLVVPPRKTARLAKLEATREAFAKIIGGPPVCGYSLSKRVMLFSQEEGKQKGFPFNCAISFDDAAVTDIYGPFLLCGFENGRYISLTIAQQKALRMQFAKPVKSVAAGVQGEML